LGHFSPPSPHHLPLPSTPSRPFFLKKNFKHWKLIELCELPNTQHSILLLIFQFFTTNNKCWWGCGEKGTRIHFLWECKLVQPLWKTIWRLLKKLYIDLPYDPEVPFLGIYWKECNSGYSRGTCTTIFIAALFTIAKLWKQPRCLNTDEWIKKMWYLYTTEFYSAMNKNGIILK
jgi:hypothetical protein